MSICWMLHALAVAHVLDDGGDGQDAVLHGDGAAPAQYGDDKIGPRVDGGSTVFLLAYLARAASTPVDPGVTTTYRIETRRSDLPYETFLVQAQGVRSR